MRSAEQNKVTVDIIKLMFGKQIARYKARSNLRRREYPNNLLTSLNRKGEFKTGIVADKFYILDRTGEWKDPHQPTQKVDPDRFTFVITIQLTARSQFMISGQASIGVAFDGEGNVGIFINGSIGGGIGVGVIAGVEGSIYFGLDRISDLQGIGNILGGYIGAGPMSSVEINSTNLFGKKNLMEKLKSVGFSYSPITAVGAGGGFFFEVSYTHFIYKTTWSELHGIFDKLVELGVSPHEARLVQRKLFNAKKIVNTVSNNF